MARSGRTTFAALVATCALLAGAAEAAAPCGCKAFVRTYVNYALVQGSLDLQLQNRGVSNRLRRKVRKRIYDYERNGPWKQSWCRRHASLCRKMRACLRSGGLAVAGAKATGAIRTPGSSRLSLARTRSLRHDDRVIIRPLIFVAALFVVMLLLGVGVGYAVMATVIGAGPGLFARFRMRREARLSAGR